MPKSCTAYGCTNRASTGDSIDRKVSFHYFPLRNPMLLKEWLLKMRRKNFTPSPTSTICSDHFEDDCFTFQNFTNTRLLKKDAVPTVFVFNRKLYVPTKRPHLKRIAIPSLCLPQTVTEDVERVLEKEKSSKKVFHSVARKKIRKVKMDDALVTSTNSTFYEKEKLPAETSVKTFLKLGNNKKTNFLDEAVTPDEVEDGAENASFYRHCDSEDIFGQYIASEMRTLKDYPLLYLQTKQSILEALTSANFEFINSE